MHVLARPEAKPLTHAIEVRIRKIQDQHKRETGMRLDADSALRELDRIDAEDTLAKRDDLAEVRKILVDGLYSARVVERVLATIREHGTIDCDATLETLLTRPMRVAIEAAIPGVSAWQWGPEYGDVTGDDRFAGSKGYAGLAIRGIAR